MRRLIVLLLAFVMLMSLSISSVFAHKATHQFAVKKEVIKKPKTGGTHYIVLAMKVHAFHYYSKAKKRYRYRIDGIWIRGYCVTHPDETLRFSAPNFRVKQTVIKNNGKVIYKNSEWQQYGWGKSDYVDGWTNVDKGINKFVNVSDITKFESYVLIYRMIEYGGYDWDTEKVGTIFLRREF